MPFRHDIRTVTVPGCVDGWVALHERFGTLPLADLLAPAIDLADDGFPASPAARRLAAPRADEGAAENLDELRQPAHAPGARVRRPGVGRTLRAIAEGGRAGVLRGRVRRRAEGARRRACTATTTSADPPAEWVDAADGARVRSRPLDAPAELAGLPHARRRADSPSRLDLPADPDDARWAHLLIEAATAAGFDRPDVLSDTADGDALLTVDRRPARHDRRTSAPRTAGRRRRDGDTTYLCTVDGNGMGVSLIQSNASGFGSWLVEPSTGINLHNRGLGFSLDEGHPAELRPGRRPPHTLCPAMATRRRRAARGVRHDGRRRPAADPAAARGPAVPPRPVARRRGAAPGAGRCRARRPASTRGPAAEAPTVTVEGQAPDEWVDGLARRGHRSQPRPPYDSGFGHAHAIVVDHDGVPCRRRRPAGDGRHRRRHLSAGARSSTISAMRVDSNFFCTVPMPDAGDPSIAATARRYGNDAVIECYENLLAWAKTADQLGFDTMWLTEHHFQYEGYEVLPNLIQFGQHLATQTEQLRLGQMFNVVPQWHPLRLAEDFALADIITGGRMEFGVGRGTVPREAWALGTVVASGDNEMSAEHDRINREIFEESMEVIKLAWYNERFSYRGKHFVLPPDDVPDRGTHRQRPDADPQAAAHGRHLPAGHLAGDDRVRAPGRPQGRLLAAERRQPEAEVGPLRRDPRGRCGTPVGPGEDRCLVLNLHVAKTREAGAGQGPPRARRVQQVPVAVRPLHAATATPTAQGAVRLHCPTVEESNAPEDPDRRLDRRRRRRASASGATCSTSSTSASSSTIPGLTREEMNEQMHLVAEEVFPRLGETDRRRPHRPPSLMSTRSRRPPTSVVDVASRRRRAIGA